jgi:shikimate dehydrogenase
MRLAVFGDPISHSLSPLLHETALRATGLEGAYAARRVDAVGMEAALAEIRAGELDGGNVTMPHKELAARLCDRLAVAAARAGAVNTLLRVGGRVIGHNTDIAGIRKAWQVAGLPGKGPVLILGAGGAAAAAALALEGRDLSICARRPAAATSLIAKVAVAATAIPWGQPVAKASIVNATPIGMRGELLDQEQLEAGAGLFDMAYGPHETPAVRQMSERGLPAADGRLMLLHQAAVAFELWTGRPAPLAEMQAALAAAAAS